MWQTERAQALGLIVMGTGELLTNVLGHLDQRTLLCSAVRVCHRWNDLIETAPDIQQRHFFSPVPQRDTSNPSPLDWDDDDDDDDSNDDDPPVRLNPLLARVFRRFFTPACTPSHIAFSDVFASPADCNRGARPHAELTPESRARFAAILQPPPPPPPQSGGASWRRALTQQPPVRRLGVWVQLQSDFRPAPGALGEPPAGTVLATTTATSTATASISGRFYVVEYPAGLRMGELYDLCLGPPGRPNLSLRPFWSPQTPAVWRPPGAVGGRRRRLGGRRRCGGGQEKELARVLQTAALHPAWQGVDGVLRLFKSSTSWDAADRVRRLDFMQQFVFPEAEAEAEVQRSFWSSLLFG
ncbi:hypothetical protein GGTG_09996 [Gaeumannomyces tritici R3-111a-1]|uniref:F-box domain-containing protein n=1 Tax=Gaeumannomyces tritici (strain R3-111a-1) TaxID=644352 RepID=J3P912_GAET3|nr:hypothetical protein GGTG_09996 [Gaeumannomyces tritici R3-111a-1]EJT73147.1 hypothetical protein GGTG_09996 [Gaeumannomyces tritici R3-111a-1]